MVPLLAIDPGLESTGWAYWMGGVGPKTPPHYFGLHKPTAKERAMPWHEQALSMAERLASFPQIAFASDTVCEMPSVFGSVKGIASAGSGAITKLAFLVGAYGSSLRENHAGNLVPVPVVQWKGQLPKEIVKQRIIGFLGEKACKDFKHDIWDAVGLGLWRRGVFL